MTQLENIKDLWKQQETENIRYSKNELQGMMVQRSSSVVKWILIISILEFILPNIIFLVTDFEASREFNEKYGLTNMVNVYLGIHIMIILGFIYVFYRNYRNISVDTSVKMLMHHIITTRKTVKYYIYYNLTIAAVIGFHMFYEVFNSKAFLSTLPEKTNLALIWIISSVLFVLVLVLLWGIYKLVFGFFLKKLNRNYQELEQVE
ncbi:MAG: hypothetical protein U5K51_15425 [Flavobacteriaceae bacterium]|nr:hypothetical protein [Flavobacteriaceae bacterium]